MAIPVLQHPHTRERRRQMQFQAQQAEEARRQQFLNAVYGRLIGTGLGVGQAAAQGALKQYFEEPWKTAKSGVYGPMLEAAAKVEAAQKAGKTAKVLSPDARGMAMETPAMGGRRQRRRLGEPAGITPKKLTEELGREQAQTMLESESGKKLLKEWKYPLQDKPEKVEEKYGPPIPSRPELDKVSAADRGLEDAKAAFKKLLAEDPKAALSFNIQQEKRAEAAERAEKSTERRLNMSVKSRALIRDDQKHLQDMVDKGMDRAAIEHESLLKTFRTMAPYIPEINEKGKLGKISIYMLKPVKKSLGRGIDSEGKPREFYQWTVEHGNWTKDDWKRYGVMLKRGKGAPDEGTGGKKGVWVSARYYGGGGPTDMKGVVLSPRNLEKPRFRKFVNGLNLTNEDDIAGLLSRGATLRDKRANLKNARQRHGKDSPQYRTAAAEETAATKDLQSNLKTVTSEEKRGEDIGEKSVKGQTARSVAKRKKEWTNKVKSWKSRLRKAKAKYLGVMAINERKILRALIGSGDKTFNIGGFKVTLNQGERRAAYLGKPGKEPPGSHTKIPWLKWKAKKNLGGELQKEVAAERKHRTEKHGGKLEEIHGIWEEMISQGGRGLPKSHTGKQAFLRWMNKKGYQIYEPVTPSFAAPGAPAAPKTPSVGSAGTPEGRIEQALGAASSAPPMEQWPEPLRVWWEINQQDLPAAAKRRMFRAQAETRGWA